MKKYAIPAVFLVAGHEAVSIMALFVAVCMFIGDIIKEREGRY